MHKFKLALRTYFVNLKIFCRVIKKFGYSGKTTENLENYPSSFWQWYTFFLLNGRFFLILWPSHNIWTLLHGKISSELRGMYLMQAWICARCMYYIPKLETTFWFTFILIVLCIKKQTNLWVGHFTTLSGHFLANYINIFHKIELQTIILMCLTCLNLIWIKSHDIKHIFFISCFLQFCKEKILKIYYS